MERRQFAHARRLPHVLVRAPGVALAALYTAALLVGFMNRRMRNRCPVVWEDGGGNPASYPILAQGTIPESWASRKVV